MLQEFKMPKTKSLELRSLKLKLLEILPVISSGVKKSFAVRSYKINTQKFISLKLLVLGSSHFALLEFGYAQTATGAAGKPSLVEQLMPFLFIILIFYFLVIRPQQRRNRDQQSFLSALKQGDEVLTTGGVFGTIKGLTDKFVTLEVSDGVRVRVLRSAIASPVSKEVLEK